MDILSKYFPAVRDRDKRCRVSKISCWALSLFPSMNEVYLTEKSPHLLIFCIKYVSHCDRALISLSHLNFILLESHNLRCRLKIKSFDLKIFILIIPSPVMVPEAFAYSDWKSRNSCIERTQSRLWKSSLLKVET